MSALLDIRGLSVSFAAGRGRVQALREVALSVAEGRTLGVVGESGCGKSLTALAVMGLLPAPEARIDAGEIWLDAGDGAVDLAARGGAAARRMRGRAMSMIFQEPMTALDPSFTIGDQITDVLRRHEGMRPRAARDRAAELLDSVGIPSPRSRLAQYPHEMSGGMRQRAMVAIALACGPRLLIADEPTTALDVTIQAQVLDLMRDMQARTGTAIVFITHDMGVIAEIAHEVAVMYLGGVVEHGPTEAILERPAHPYTQGLIRSVPTLGMGRGMRLQPIPGAVPPLSAAPHACRFQDRCPHVFDRCRTEEPPMHPTGPHHRAACWLAGQV